MIATNWTFLLEVLELSASKWVRVVLYVCINVHSQTERNVAIPLVKSKSQPLGMLFQNLDQKSNRVEIKWKSLYILLSNAADPKEAATPSVVNPDLCWPYGEWNELLQTPFEVRTAWNYHICDRYWALGWMFVHLFSTNKQTLFSFSRTLCWKTSCHFHGETQNIQQSLQALTLLKRTVVPR